MERREINSLRMLASRLLVPCLLLSGIPALAETASELEEQRDAFRAAWAAAARGDRLAVTDAIERLSDYPLAPYLEFERLRQRIDRVPESEISRFLARYRDWSFAETLEIQWLRSLGRRGEDAVLLRHGRASDDTEVRCHVAMARIRTGEIEGLDAAIASIWLHPESQPGACDPPFAWWRRQGYPSVSMAWQRFGMAISAGETGLARYLRRYLSTDDRIWADRWLAVAARPVATLRDARGWRDHERAQEIAGWGLRRLARSDWQRADQSWALLENHFRWAPAQSSAITREIALYRAVALDPGAVSAIDALGTAQIDQQMLEWRLRAALTHGDWKGVLTSVQLMAPEEQLRSRWRYWRARALAALERPDAALHFAALAVESDYYGFLAAVRLGKSFSLCPRELRAEPAVQRRLLRDAEIERALELHTVGLNHHARWTWQRAGRRMGRLELEQAALLAAGRGWHDRAIFALGSAGARTAYPWRFPLIERGRVLAAGGRFGVDPARIYGLMRAESTMQADALSPAGARGLLQLMPATAEAVARRNGLEYGGLGELMSPAVNIPLGVAHLAELQQRFEGDWTRVAAAYNAGIRAVERWLDERPVTEPDIWLESLPFFETRDYVPRVLAFATIYEWLLDQPPRILAENIFGRAPRAGGFACYDAQSETAAPVGAE